MSAEPHPHHAEGSSDGTLAGYELCSSCWLQELAQIHEVDSLFFVFEPTKSFLCFPFIIPGDYASTQLPYHTASNSGDDLMGHSDLAETVAEAPCLRFPEPWGASQEGCIISSWLVNLLLFALIAAEVSQKSFYLHNLQ